MTDRRRLLVLLAGATAAGGWSDAQSALAPAGAHAAQVDRLTFIMTVGATAILGLVIVATAFAILAPRRWRAGWMDRAGFVVSLGVVFPVVVLSALLGYGFVTARALVQPGPPQLRIAVVGERWWWRVHYLDAEERIVLASANEIRIPIGMVVEFVLTSPDVIHSFWVPALAGKLDMIPGRTNRYRFAAERPGVYRGQCAEYCGEQHALMAFHVVAEERDAFEAWYARETQPAAAPATPETARGRDLFLAQGCGACHTVRGTPANGTIGPDLTHVGNRRAIAAGTFVRNAGTLAGWIASSQHLKPGNLMPSFDTLDGEELRAIAAWLESLE